ncbi:MAG TPA: hypothetical protein VH089_24810, partial [Streptosporangiaceae bacterium]|nr:hypothetical protein [Streptosporangiaceae bacterium]
MEFDPVQQGAVVDGTRVGGPAPQGLPVRLPGPPHVGLADVGERDQLDGVHLDQRPARADRVATARLDLGPLPQPERHRDLSGQHVVPQFLAELHGSRLRR